jgi:hypothetical protein
LRIGVDIQRAVDAAIGDREGAVGEIVDRELPVARLPGQRRYRLLDLGFLKGRNPLPQLLPPPVTEREQN